MPLERHLHEVCQRAVSEEMQQLVDAETLIMPGSPLPLYDAANKSRINVVNEVFKDHVVEIEESKSFPGLLTVYNLYRVDIVCTGLPTLNFNTLEFNEPDKDGERKLKYMHAWVWLKLDVIQRYLFEGSTLKERVCKGSCESPEQLQDWLSQFGVVLGSSSSSREKSVEDLFQEVEAEKCTLEHYGRLDGLPILLRVVHVVQVKLTNRHHQAHQTFVIQEAKQRGSSGIWASVNRHLSTKVNMSRNDFDHSFFASRAASLVEETIYSITDVHYSINPKAKPREEDFQKARLEVEEANFESYRYHIEKSPSYEDILTMYHMYTVLVVCDGLPNPDFGSISFEKGYPEAYVWRWVTWETSMDLISAQRRVLLRREMQRAEEIRATRAAGQECMKAVKKALSDLEKKVPQKGTEIFDLRARLLQLEAEVISPLEEFSNWSPDKEVSATDRLPPSMVSSLTDRKLVTDDFLAEVSMLKRIESVRSHSHSRRTSYSKLSSFSGSDSRDPMETDWATPVTPGSRDISPWLASASSKSRHSGTITRFNDIRKMPEQTSESYSPSYWFCCSEKKTRTKL